MGITSNESKQRWNAGHYTQVKVSVDPGLAAAFKERCAAKGVSVAGELSRLMSAETGGKRPPKPAGDQYATRQKRRKALGSIAAQLSAIMGAEQGYLDSIPENLQGAPQYEATEEIISALDEALNALSGVYG